MLAALAIPYVFVVEPIALKVLLAMLILYLWIVVFRIRVMLFERGIRSFGFGGRSEIEFSEIQEVRRPGRFLRVCVEGKERWLLGMTDSNEFRSKRFDEFEAIILERSGKELSR